jgi:3-mercaptopyruvate sulfurtransferase SseA
MDGGYRKVRPLAGGLEAWLDAGMRYELFSPEH